jgi:hypothetical protein
MDSLQRDRRAPGDYECLKEPRNLFLGVPA